MRTGGSCFIAHGRVESDERQEIAKNISCLTAPMKFGLVHWTCSTVSKRLFSSSHNCKPVPLGLQALGMGALHKICFSGRTCGTYATRVSCASILVSPGHRSMSREARCAQVRFAIQTLYAVLNKRTGRSFRSTCVTPSTCIWTGQT